MSQVVFDIETVGENFETDFNEEEQDYLLKYAKSEEEKEEHKLKTALSPLTGKVVSIGYLTLKENKGLVQTVSDKIQSYENENTKFEFVKTEQELLNKFWEVVSKTSQVITFNGRGFDIPFILLRSAINKIKPSKNLMGNRYKNFPHCDLLDQMSLYGALFYPKTLHFYTRAFGIKSPKDGMKGVQVTEYYNAGKHQEIAEYCMKDVVATGELYSYFEKYLKFDYDY
ncbi:hypothetical protein A2X44_00925 [candidate division CPR3 bacterium GWF2_35_18]|uniref:Predicted 3'-5' exonuclease PolB-like domain-containing protein n=1 Tax=candidate division CPR3 bacterium GW2011_GWF2_35_18 TaxID=1618350 RepID=A0A0G0E4K2_UNCC3|nr:MAG: hypothetical protein UR67_C0001G0164 [candidate division CPR3 bacterium GW2011_GWF2_35_18]KKP86150.1 MAG: hypothetical protein UR87_C0028G0014 [candidate division CPR3 bacterium GW2011_GWE2_35_7]OGB63468.1 MAG: hypothetical protein A2X44_00925 [candidate division CPR3 bacterium GWF2_35_18]OGB64787.1 MAG: hypothetical protein A2250_05100 [candidate division CPR3 bacterium RIFOXYA2_FULL_35_13]OGB78586.1 MAG: hypothetical protein A2296_01530 [candidate division CPR3 bacterium RIFOXYB2_FULL